MNWWRLISIVLIVGILGFLIINYFHEKYNEMTQREEEFVNNYMGCFERCQEYGLKFIGRFDRDLMRCDCCDGDECGWPIQANETED